MTEPELDTAIDRAVRDLMNVDADSAFRTRVTARLERPARRTWAPRLLTAVVTASAIAAVLIWMRPSPTDIPASVPMARDHAVPRAGPSPMRPVGGQKAAVVPPGAPPVRTDRPSSPVEAIRRRVVVAAVAEAEPAIPPLTALDAIDVEPISQTPIATAQILVVPLSAIPELHVSPLEPPAAR